MTRAAARAVALLVSAGVAAMAPRIAAGQQAAPADGAPAATPAASSASPTAPAARTTAPSALTPAVAPLTPLAAPGTLPAAPPSPWRFAGLPDQKLPATRYDIVMLDGQPALRVRAEASYGNLLHPLRGRAGQLQWRWRVDEFLAAADLRSKAGDDTSVKVCALFDMPLEHVPFVERQLLRLARSRAAEPLPAATLCYVWDRSLAPGTLLANAYSARVRYMVLRGGETQGWASESRDLNADFLRAFGTESAGVPPLLAIAVGADADNTSGRSLAHVADLRHGEAAGR